MIILAKTQLLMMDQNHFICVAFSRFDLKDILSNEKFPNGVHSFSLHISRISQEE